MPSSLLADRLRAMRALRNLTVTEVAARIGVQQRTYRDYESGTTEPGASRLALMAEVFGVTTDYLVGRVDAQLGLDPGTWIIDLDAVGERGQTWCAQVPRRYKIVTYDEMKRIESNQEAGE